MTDLIVAGGLMPSAWLKSAELLTALNQTPLAAALSKFVWTAQQTQVTEQGPVALTLGHEHFIQQALKIEQIGVWYALAALQTASSSAMAAQTGLWWRIDPVYLQLATDHITLANADLDDLSIDQASALVSSLQPLLDQYQATIIMGSARHWFLHLPVLKQVKCSSSLAAMGRSIEVYLPREVSGQALRAPDQGRLWRRFCTEVEMIWFNHPVNLQRQALGQSPANSVWLQGSIELPLNQALSKTDILSVCAATFKPRAFEQAHDWVTALAQFSAEQCQKWANQSSLQLVLGGDFQYRILHGTKPRWWQKPTANVWALWRE